MKSVHGFHIPPSLGGAFVGREPQPQGQKRARRRAEKLWSAHSSRAAAMWGVRWLKRMLRAGKTVRHRTGWGRAPDKLRGRKGSSAVSQPCAAGSCARVSAKPVSIKAYSTIAAKLVTSAPPKNHAPSPNAISAETAAAPICAAARPQSSGSLPVSAAVRVNQPSDMQALRSAASSSA